MQWQAGQQWSPPGLDPNYMTNAMMGQAAGFGGAVPPYYPQQMMPPFQPVMMPVRTAAGTVQYVPMPVPMPMQAPVLSPGAYPSGSTQTLAAPSSGPVSSSGLRFHSSAEKSGDLSEDYSNFTKTKFSGRLSIIAVDEVKKGGVHRCACRFVGGKVSAADGFGFIFASSLPPTQNIQKVESVFVNKNGVVCSRTRNGVRRDPIQLAPLDVGARVDVLVDLDQKRATFSVDHSGKSSSVVCDFDKLVPEGPVSGFFGAVVKNGGCVLQLEPSEDA